MSSQRVFQTFKRLSLILQGLVHNLPTLIFMIFKNNAFYSFVAYGFVDFEDRRDAQVMHLIHMSGLINFISL